MAEMLRVLLLPVEESEVAYGTHIYLSEFSTPEHIAAVFSAVRMSTRIQCIHLQSVQDEEQAILELDDAITMIRRFAPYALFSSHAQHQIQRVAIDCRLITEEAITMMRETLCVKNPLGACYHQDANLEPRWISASRFIVTVPDIKSTEPSVLYDFTSPITVPVIDTDFNDGDEKFWWVILPGLGESWVPEQDGCVVAETEPKNHATSVSHLELVNMNELSMPRIFEFLQILQDSVKIVEVKASDNDFSIDGWPSQVLSICRHLEELILPDNSALENLHEFLDSGDCRLCRLVVDYDLDWDSAKMEDFIKALCDPIHPFTSSLEELKLTVVVDNDSTPIFVDRVQEMLQLNRHLHTVQFCVMAPRRLGDVTIPYGRVAIRTAPLALRKKLAFLSAMSKCSRCNGWLDTHIVGLIFMFAAQHRLRTVDIETFYT